MRSKLMTTTMMMAMSAVLGACDGGEKATELNAEKLSSQTGVFLNPVKRSAGWRQNFDENGRPIGFNGFWYACNSNEVMVGIHYIDGVVTCATISNGVRVQRRTVDQTGSGTKAPWNGLTPQMHGCPVNSWVQGVLKEGAKDEDLLCVTLVNSLGQA